MSTVMDLTMITTDFAQGLVQADARQPAAVNARTGAAFLPGVGPHTESQTVELVVRELVAAGTGWAEGAVRTSVPYPEAGRQRCDLCIGAGPAWDWCIEVKMLRMLGDNGKSNDNILMHILSPYPAHRSALTDCDKLLMSGFAGRKAVLIYGYDAEAWPLEPAIDAFEALASARGRLGPRQVAEFRGLVHPVHRQGKVFAWELLGQP